MGIVWGVSKTLVLMFLVMFTFKLAGVITFSWWVVTAPLWAPVLIASVVLLFIFTLAPIKGK